MAQNKKGLTDPVEKSIEGLAQAQVDQDLAGLDPENAQADDFSFLRPDEIGTIKQQSVGASHPFTGYKMGRNVMVGEASVSSTYVVLLTPIAEPQEDRSNLGKTIYVGPVGHNTPDTGGKATVVNFPTSHSRTVTDRTGINHESIVFDREITLADGRQFKCAIVRSHTARSQVVFKFDGKRNKITPDNRYMLADPKQAERLLKLFRALHFQRTREERAAKEFDVAKESTAADRG